MALTTSDLLTEVKLRGNIPNTTDSDSVNYDANILRLASSVLLSRIVPAILTVREDFYVTSSDYTITAGEERYKLPTRAIGSALRDVRVKTETEEYSLPIIPPERRQQVTQDEVRGYYLEHDDLILYPNPIRTGDTLVVSYFQRPNRLAAVSDCDTVATVNADYLTTTGALTGTLTKDFIRQDTPHSFVATSTAAKFGTAGGPTPPDVAVGDYVCPVGKSPVPQMPEEFWNALVCYTAAVVLQAMESPAYATFQKEGDDTIGSLLEILTPRTQGELPKILPPW